VLSSIRHTPKNVAIALVAEASELLEPFQWLTPDRFIDFASDLERSALTPDQLADVLIYVVHLADILDIDLNVAVASKSAANAEKYPANRAKGSAAKYAEYDP
jgi:dCTP diphosphatase